MRISDERRRIGFNQSKLAEKLAEFEGCENISQSTIATWENGNIPPLRRLVALSAVFDCDVSYLLGESDRRNWSVTESASVTGLSVEAINALRRFRATDSEGWPCSIDYTGLLSSLLTHPQFEDFLLDALQAVQHQKEGEPELSKSDPAEYKTQFSQLQVKVTDLGLTFLNNRELHRFYAQEAARTMTNILNDLGKEG